MNKEYHNKNLINVDRTCWKNKKVILIKSDWILSKKCQIMWLWLSSMKRLNVTYLIEHSHINIIYRKGRMSSNHGYKFGPWKYNEDSRHVTFSVYIITIIPQKNRCKYDQSYLQPIFKAKEISARRHSKLKSFSKY